MEIELAPSMRERLSVGFEWELSEVVLKNKALEGSHISMRQQRTLLEALPLKIKHANTEDTMRRIEDNWYFSDLMPKAKEYEGG
jgi:hypothetical protein